MAQQVAPDPRLGGGGEVLGLDGGNLVEAAGGQRQVCGGVRGQPAGGALDPDAPPLGAGGAEQQRDGIGRGGRDARHAIAGGSHVDGVVAEQGTDAVEEAHGASTPHSTFRTPDHSRHACTGTTFPGFTRSSGSNTWRTARMAARESPSKIIGM